MKPKLMCPECHDEFKEVKELPVETGVQWDRYVKGYYVLYECSCGERYWEYRSKR